MPAYNSEAGTSVGFFPGLAPGFFVRPAWARSLGWKSPAKLTTARQVKCNCVRETERGEEAWSVNRESRYTNRIRGGTDQGEQARDCEALVVKGRGRKCGDCAVKDRVLTWGDLALRLKGRRPRAGARSQQRP